MTHYSRLTRRQIARLIRACMQARHLIPRELRADLADLVRAAHALDAGMPPALTYVTENLRLVRRARIRAEAGSEPPRCLRHMRHP